MEIDSRYKEQVTLLLDVLPFVAEERCFALKGGTAINMFEWDLPRLSVDIDLTYLPIEGRDTSLRAISEALSRIKDRMEDKLKPIRVTLVTQGGGLEVKLHCQRFRTQIKIEVNAILRGHLMPTRIMACCDRAQEQFARFVETRVVSRGELFGGKICAALDRQHPRDLFDVKLLLDNDDSLTDDLKNGMIAGLISHGRPIAELIRPRLKDRAQSFKSEFEGMSFLPFTYDDHVATLERLTNDIAKSLTDDDKTFLMSVESGAPDWSKFSLSGADAMPAPQWKQQNIGILRGNDPDRHRQHVRALEAVLFAA